MIYFNMQVGPDGGDTPLVKLFEFLVASMCLFLISDNDPLEPRKREVHVTGNSRDISQGSYHAPGPETAIGPARNSHAHALHPWCCWLSRMFDFLGACSTSQGCIGCR